MKKSIIIFLFLTVTAAFSQTKRDALKIDHYRTSAFDCTIFPANYGMIVGEKRFTPTRQEIDKAETALELQLTKLNAKRPNQSSSPIIDKNLSKYVRQYFGYIDKQGHRILFINCLWKKENEDYLWLKEQRMVLDGGSYYWNIKFDLN